MDRVSRVIACLLCFFALPALADVYTITNRGATASGSTPLAAYTAWAAAYNATLEVACIRNGQNTSAWQAAAATQFDDPGKRIRVQFNESPIISGSYQCGWASIYDWVSYTVLTGADCAANKELDEDLGTCVCKSIRDAGMHMVNGDVYTGCNDGCRMVLNSGWFDKTAGVTWGNWSQSSAACTVGDNNVIGSTDPKVEAAKKCTAGTCPGTVNGQSVCLPCDKSKETGTTTKTESSSTTASGASSPSSSGTSSGSTTTKTECSGGQCKTTTTTTSTGADGTTTDKTTETTQPHSDYCTDNPKAEVCKGTESSWGGTCEAFTCDGDAIQCAQAKAGWELACALKVDEGDPLIAVGQQATSAGDRPADHPANDENSVAVDLSSRLSSVPLFGTSGDCIADKSITFMGKGYTLPFSKWCPYLNILGSAFLAACYLAAAFIIFRD